MSTTPPLAIRIAELHQGHHSKRCLTTGVARSAAPARMFSKKNKISPGAGFHARSIAFVVLLFIGFFIGFLYNIYGRFAGFYFYPPHQTTRPTLFNRRMFDRKTV
jgi:hypothetical protein